MSENKVIDLSERDLNKLLKETHHGGLVPHLERLKLHNSNIHWSSIKYKQTGETVLHLAARFGQIETIDYLLTSCKTCFDRSTGVDCRTNDDKTALHEAAQYAQPAAISRLLEFGANIDALKRADWTPLMLACTKTCLESVRLLLSKGALVNYCNKDGWSCLHLATRTGSLEIVELLLLNDKIDVTAVTKNKRTVLHIAALHGHELIVNRLLNISSLVEMIDFRDSCGDTPLFQAAINGNVEICKLLISKGANPHLTNNLDFNILHLVASNKELTSYDIFSFILDDLKINVNSTNKNGFSALHCAARKKLFNIYEVLVNRGGNQYLSDVFGRTPIDYLNN